ncbi:MAG: ABC transporter substrate-binding protein [Dehalococcoidia bacterium]|nr:ABC transporter substrate-binding protein [Dehalococcoidia bacterium]
MALAIGDVGVRKALQLAMDSKEIADKLFRGYGRTYTLNVVIPTAFFYEPNQIRVDPFDSAWARKLLAEAGYPNGFKARI